MYTRLLLIRPPFLSISICLCMSNTIRSYKINKIQCWYTHCSIIFFVRLLFRSIILVITVTFSLAILWFRISFPVFNSNSKDCMRSRRAFIHGSTCLKTSPILWNYISLFFNDNLNKISLVNEYFTNLRFPFNFD